MKEARSYEVGFTARGVSREAGGALVELATLLSGIGVFAFSIVSSPTFHAVMSDTLTDIQALLPVAELSAAIMELNGSGELSITGDTDLINAETQELLDAVTQQSNVQDFCIAIIDQLNTFSCAFPADPNLTMNLYGVFPNYGSCASQAVPGECFAKAATAVQGECFGVVGCLFTMSAPELTTVFPLRVASLGGAGLVP